MDRGHLESGHRMHQGQPRLPKLLRRTHGPAPSGHGPAQLQTGVQGDGASVHAGTPHVLEKAQDDLRELHGRPVPRGRAHGIHKAGVQGDGKRPLAYLPGADQAGGAAVRHFGPACLAQERVDGGDGGGQGAPVPDGKP